VTSLRPNQRNIGMVFQAYALFPNMTVAQNIAFGLKVGWPAPKADQNKRVAEMLRPDQACRSLATAIRSSSRAASNSA
jgi:ABC-type Fe3+/spermidine/putrescine transport system ATPase subunit